MEWSKLISLGQCRFRICHVRGGFNISKIAPPVDHTIGGPTKEQWQLQPLPNTTQLSLSLYLASPELLTLC